MSPHDKKTIGIWLLIGIAMIYAQVVIGGITRLTGSGLSITRWEVVTGTVPPLSEEDWLKEFSHYQQSPQYRKVNSHMSLPEFKQIFFWEYFHRLWGRLLGLIFLVPFCYFLIKKKFSPDLIRKALVAFALGALVGIFGWIMVASGLSDRPMVSPYKLALHLSLAILTLGYLLWIALELLVPQEKKIFFMQKKFLSSLTILVCAQIIFGAIVSGMHAVIFFPTWPDMNGEFIPTLMLDPQSWNWQSFTHFDQYAIAPAIFQFLHRMTGYAIFFIGIFLLIKNFRSDPQTKKFVLILNGIIFLQVVLGIFTLIAARRGIPVTLGVIHQAIGILTLVWLIVMNFFFTEKKSFVDSGKNLFEEIKIANARTTEII